MKKTQQSLMAAYIASLVISGLTVVLFETELLPSGILKSGGSDEFVLTMVMELVSICAIPFMLRLFRFEAIRKKLVSAEALLRFGMARLLALCLPMVINTILYYLYMNVAFGYLTIVLLLALTFIVPTKARCESEINNQKNHTYH